MMLKGKVCENPKLIKTNEELVNLKGTKGKAKAWKGNIAQHDEDKFHNLK